MTTMSLATLSNLTFLPSLPEVTNCGLFNKILNLPPILTTDDSVSE